MVLPLLFTLIVSPRVQAHTRPARPKQGRLKQTRPIAPSKAPPVLLGVVDEEKLAQSRSDFPMLLPKVLPQVVAGRHLRLVVTRQGWKWGQSQMPSIDVTPDVLLLLLKMPASPGALSGAQYDAARHALDALSALDVALRVGNLSYAAYNERLTNTSIAFDAALKGVPESALRTQLLRAMQSFLDLRTAWDASFEAIKQADKQEDKDIEARDKGLVDFLGQALYEQQRPELEKGDQAGREQIRQEAFKSVLSAQEKPAHEVEAADKLLSITFSK